MRRLTQTRYIDVTSSSLHNLVWQLVDRIAGAGEMRCQQFSYFADGEDDGAIEILRSVKCDRMSCTNFCQNSSPHFSCTPTSPTTAYLWARGRDKNQNRIAIARFLHAELEESPLCPRQSIILEFAPLHKNPNLPGTFSPPPF